MKRIRPLSNTEYEKLEWDIFKDYNMIRIRTDSDGNCFFHALAKAYFKPYITGKIGDSDFNRRDFIKNLRKDLSKTLAVKKTGSKKTYYETLSNGEFPKIAKEMSTYSLKNMQKELDSNASISNIYNEFISNQLAIDIYILDGIKRDVYMTGTDDQLLYKNRKSVVVLYLPGHYELIGIMHPKDFLETYFSPDSSFISSIKKRMNQLRN